MFSFCYDFMFLLIHASLDFLILFHAFTLVASLGLSWAFMLSWYLVVIMVGLDCN